MITILDVAAIRETEAGADSAGYSYASMMDDAGRAAAERAMTLLSGRSEPKVTVLIGTGNNGGDGLVTGRYLMQLQPDAQVRFYLLTKRDDDLFLQVQESGGFIAFAEDDHDNRVLRNMVASADLVIDALFGIGARLPIKGEAAKILRGTTQALNERASARRPQITLDPTTGGQVERPPKTYVLAIDCPSGLDCDTGEIDKNALHADETITFIAAKPGLFAFPGAAAVGRLHVAPLNMPENIEPIVSGQHALLDNESVRNLLPQRPPDGHKGTYGKAMIVAGSINYTGAAGLAARAAYRSGAGLITVGGPAPVISTLAAQMLEATWLLLPHDLGVIADKAASVIHEELGTYDALLVGPGLGRESITRDMLRDLLGQKNSAQKRRIGFGVVSPDSDGQETLNDNAVTLPSLVLDADGLNLLAELPAWSSLLQAETILTPHPGEMARLCGMEVADVQKNRLALATEKAVEWNVILVFKGAHTVIAAPDGRAALSPFKTDALSKAGTGDILAGLIVGLLAQGLKPFDAAQVGVYLHGLAGVIAAQHEQSGRSVLAGDVADQIGAAFNAIETG